MSDQTGQLRQRKSEKSAEGEEIDPQLEAALEKLKNELRSERQKTTLLRRPFTTLSQFGLALLPYIKDSISYVWYHPWIRNLLLFCSALLTIGFTVQGSHQPFLYQGFDFFMFVMYWCILGVASSIGLGTGLHTFVLYLGPHIAKVTLELTCAGEDADTDCVPLTFWPIFWKIQLAAFAWGAGTAIGELPPYFVSRAATLSGKKLAEFDELDEVEKHHDSFIEKVKLFIFHGLQKFGFWAIVLCASIPNPLFDLAGLTCGHFLVPFWTFFGATFIGKAIFKAHGQAMFVIFVCMKSHLETTVDFVESMIPLLKGKVHKFLESQRPQQFKDHEHREHHSKHLEGSKSIFAKAWDVFLILMISLFLRSIVDSTVQERLAIQDQEKLEQFKAEWKQGKRQLNRGQH